MKHAKYAHAFEVVADLPEPLRGLRKLAYNFHWAWCHETRQLFRSIDPKLWEQFEHNPVKVLHSLSQERLQQLQDDREFLQRLEEREQGLDDYLAEETWFEKNHPDRKGDTLIAYFCAEFGVSESLPIYSGGLGVLAGDHLKAASDLGIPLVGMGLLYARGYFRQFLSPDGWQQEHYPRLDFYTLPLQLVRGEDGKNILIHVDFPDRTVRCRIWRANVGRVQLFLLDSNILENEPDDQGITDTLYGGDEEMRIRQEMILGKGGMLALKAMGLKPSVCHLNEGHAAFLSIERIHQVMEEHGVDFATARQLVRNGNVFTTHTPVPAGFDLFQKELLQRYTSSMIGQVGLNFEDFIKLGKINPENDGEAFNMAVLAMSTSNHINGVSQLHADVTRSMFSSMWSDFPEEEVPIEGITNGIHTTTWLSRRMTLLFDKYLGKDWRRAYGEARIWEGLDNIPDEELWETLQIQRTSLVRYVRDYLVEREERFGFSRRPDRFQNVLDEGVLTIGFARRFATYKRATLMLADRDRLRRLLFHPERPVQIVLAGKSHPRDDGGKKLIQELVNFARNEGARERLVFLEDYDMHVARALVQGVDLWLNNPRRPMEASGTSGMKAVPNGGLNCSILDGWWDEGYDPMAGWAIGSRDTVTDEGHQDWIDSSILYRLIEEEIAPVFYKRNSNGIPEDWLAMVRHSIKHLSPRFSTGRMVKDYAEKFYVPASICFNTLKTEGLKGAKDALQWKDRVVAAWPQVRIGSVNGQRSSVLSIEQDLNIEARIELGTLTPDDVRVEAIVGTASANRELYDTCSARLQYAGKVDSVHVFKGTVPCDVPGHRGYAIRVLPEHKDVQDVAELRLVTWEAPKI